MNNVGTKMGHGTRRFFAHRVHLPLPVLVLKIALLIGLLALSTVFIVRTVLLTKTLEWQPTPMILVPGLMGSKLYVEGFDVKYGSNVKGKCQEGNIAFRKSWASQLLEKEPDCELFLLSQHYNVESGKFADQPGVTVTSELRGVPFGLSLWPIQCTFTDENATLCDYSTYIGNDESYFRRFTEFLTKYLKYQPGKTLFAGQYDWRQDQRSDVMLKYYGQLKQLVERIVRQSKRKVLLLGHSMGNIVINRFLRSDFASEEWQKTHLEGTINVAAPYGGTAVTMKNLLSSDPMLNGSISGRLVTNFVQKMAFPANLLPFPNAFAEEVLLQVQTGEKAAYTGSEVDKFLQNVRGGYVPFLQPFYAENEPKPQPHIPMYCIYGIGSNNTEFKFTFKTMEDEQPSVQMGDGDGAVNAQSLRMCQKWKEQGHQVKVQEFADIRHTEILMRKEFFAHISELLISL